MYCFYIQILNRRSTTDWSVCSKAVLLQYVAMEWTSLAAIRWDNVSSETISVFKFELYILCDTKFVSLIKIFESIYFASEHFSFVSKPACVNKMFCTYMYFVSYVRVCRWYVICVSKQVSYVYATAKNSLNPWGKSALTHWLLSMSFHNMKFSQHWFR